MIMPNNTIDGTSQTARDFLSEVGKATDGDFGRVRHLWVSEDGRIIWTALVGPKVKDSFGEDEKQGQCLRVNQALHKAFSIETEKDSGCYEREDIHRLREVIDKVTVGEWKDRGPQWKSVSVFLKSIANKIGPPIADLDDIPCEKNNLEIFALGLVNILASKAVKAPENKQIADGLSAVKLALIDQAHNTESGMRGDLTCIKDSKGLLENLKFRLLTLENVSTSDRVIKDLDVVIGMMNEEEPFLEYLLGTALTETKKFEPFVNKLSAVVRLLGDVEAGSSLDEAASNLKLKDRLDALANALVPRTTLNRDEINQSVKAACEVLQSVKSSLGDSRVVGRAIDEALEAKPVLTETKADLARSFQELSRRILVVLSALDENHHFGDAAGREELKGRLSTLEREKLIPLSKKLACSDADFDLASIREVQHIAAFDLGRAANHASGQVEDAFSFASNIFPVLFPPSSDVSRTKKGIEAALDVISNMIVVLEDVSQNAALEQFRANLILRRKELDELAEETNITDPIAYSALVGASLSKISNEVGSITELREQRSNLNKVIWEALIETPESIEERLAVQPIKAFIGKARLFEDEFVLRNKLTPGQEVLGSLCSE